MVMNGDDDRLEVSEVRNAGKVSPQFYLVEERVDVALPLHAPAPAG